MLIFFVALAVAAAALLYAMAMKAKQADQAMDLALLQLLAEARSKLSPESMAELERTLAELARAARIAQEQGMDPRKAARMGKNAVMQQIIAAMEVEKMFSGPVRFG
jgi:hypothetical protein